MVLRLRGTRMLKWTRSIPGISEDQDQANLVGAVRARAPPPLQPSDFGPAGGPGWAAAVAVAHAGPRAVQPLMVRVLSGVLTPELYHIMRVFKEWLRVLEVCVIIGTLFLAIFFL